MTDYTIDRQEAAEMLADFGQDITVTRRSSGAYDPATGTATITTTNQSTKGVILPLSAYRKATGGNVVEGDQQLLMSALKSDGSVLSIPHVDDTVTDSASNVWSLVAIEPLTPAGTDILYDCIVRRAA
jgi:hypothetical protein